MKTRLSISERRRARARMDQSVDDQPKHTQGELEVRNKTEIHLKDFLFASCIGETKGIEAEVFAQRIVKAVNIVTEMEKEVERLKNKNPKNSKDFMMEKYLNQLFRQAEGK